MRKCNALIRQNTRLLDRDLARLRNLESRTKADIVSANRRASPTSSRATAPRTRAAAAAETRMLACGLLRIRAQTSRLTTGRAQLESVRMRVQEAFAMRRIEGSLRASTGIMREVNSLVRMPVLSDTMRQLSTELVKAGIIEEDVNDALPTDDLADDELEAADAEVDGVLAEVLRGRMPAAAPADVVAPEPTLPEPEMPTAADKDYEEQQAALEQMRGRLEALKS